MTTDKEKAELELAKAMNRMAESIEHFQDPVWIQKVFGDAIQTMAGVPQIAPAVARALPPGVTLEAITISLSEKDRKQMSRQIYTGLKPHLKEFNQFIKDSLKDMPPHRLKELARRIEQGAKPTLERRRGCVYIKLDTGDEYYLGL